VADNWGIVSTVDEIYGGSYRETYRDQTAFFGELNWAISDRFDATIGMRDYEYEDSLFLSQFGFWFNSTTPITAADIKGRNSGQTYKASLSWTPSENSLIYVQWAEGFRPGEPLVRQNPALFDPEGTGFYEALDGKRIPIRDQTDPDTLDSYEIGFKGSFANNRINLSGAVYHIDWEGLPVFTFIKHKVDPNLTGRTIVNAGKSTSQGIELESRILLRDNLLLDLSASYNESKLAEDGALGEKGDDLPGSADFNFTAGLEYAFSLLDHSSYVRVDYSYLSEFDTYLPGEAKSAVTPSSGGYGLVNLKGGVEVGDVDLSLYVKNLTDADDFTWLATDFSLAGPRGFRLRPRTIGVNVSYGF